MYDSEYTAMAGWYYITDQLDGISETAEVDIELDVNVQGDAISPPEYASVGDFPAGPVTRKPREVFLHPRVARRPGPDVCVPERGQWGDRQRVVGVELDELGAHHPRYLPWRWVCSSIRSSQRSTSSSS